MKRILFTLLICFPLIVLSQKTVKVSGTVTGPGANSTLIVHGANPVAQGILKAELSSEFQQNVSVKEPYFATILSGSNSHPVFLEAGHNVELNVKLSEHKMVLEVGGDPNNKVLADFFLLFASDFNQKAISANILKANSPDLFEMELFQKQKKQEQYLASHRLKGQVTKSFLAKMDAFILYNYWYNLLAYPIIRANSNTGMAVQGLPRVMLEPIHEQILNPENMVGVPSFREFLYYYTTYMGSQANLFKKFSDRNLSMEKKNEVIQKSLKGPGHSYILSRFLVEHCGYLDSDKLKEFMAKLESQDKNYYELVNASCKEVLDRKIAEAKAEKAKTKKSRKKSKPSKSGKAPKYNVEDLPYTLLNLEGQRVGLEEFAGKVVYIDFWASWCRPCLGQFPFSKKLHERFTEKELKEVEFLYVSIDSDENRWKAAVERIGMAGYQVFSPGGWKSSAASYFRLSSIPRYMLMDKTGKIVNSSARRPSDPVIYDDMIELLKQ